jgi:ABC-type nitrate/sulfonate/bicarbonate transport system substrate-binding protein
LRKIKVLASVQSHMPLMSVLSYSGVAKAYGLEISVDVTGQDGAPSIDERSEALLKGDYQFISGLHHEPYFMRARGDKRLTYLAQGQNLWDDRFVVVPGIKSPRDLEGKSIFVGSKAPCVMGNFKGVLESAGVDLDSIKFVTSNKMSIAGNFNEAINEYMGSTVQAALVDMPFDLVGTKKGFKILKLPDRPVVHNVTVCATTDYIAKNEDVVAAFLKSFIAAVHFFKTNPSKTTEILRKRVAPIIGIEEHKDEVKHLYKAWSNLLLAKPYPLPEAIQNTFELDAAKDSLAKKMNPIEPWDLHYLKQIDDSNFIDKLYRN